MDSQKQVAKIESDIKAAILKEKHVKDAMQGKVKQLKVLKHPSQILWPNELPQNPLTPFFPVHGKRALCSCKKTGNARVKTPGSR